MATESISERSITILTAFYKSADLVQSKIQNLQKQTIFNECTIVILNCQNLEGEREQYREFLENNHNVIEIFYENHIRLYPTWDDGIKATKSEFICNSNADDMWHPQYLEKCRKYLYMHQNIACVSSKILLTYTKNQIDHNSWKHEHTLPKGTYPQTTAGPCPVWRRSLHDKYGYFGNYRTIGDAKMWEKWHAGNEKFGYIDEALVLYYASGMSLERRVDLELGKSFRELDLEDEQTTSNQTS